MLIAIPFNQCAIQLFLRNARNVSEISLSFWLVFSMLPLSYIGMVLEGKDTSFMNYLNAVDWIITIGVGISTVVS